MLSALQAQETSQVGENSGIGDQRTLGRTKEAELSISFFLKEEVCAGNFFLCKTEKLKSEH
jgi:hypothetical protein